MGLLLATGPDSVGSFVLVWASATPADTSSAPRLSAAKAGRPMYSRGWYLGYHTQISSVLKVGAL